MSDDIEKKDLKDLDPSKTTICIIPSDDGNIKFALIIGQENPEYIYNVVNSFEDALINLAKNDFEKDYYKKIANSFRLKVENKLKERGQFYSFNRTYN